MTTPHCREGFIRLLIAGSLITATLHGSPAASPSPSENGTTGQASDSKPRIFYTPADIARLQKQANSPELAETYAALEQQSQKNLKDWLKKYPATATPRSTEELLEIGGRDKPWRNYTLATAYALHPTAELGRALREQLMTYIGDRKTRGFWRGNDGIHEGEATLAFLEAYDIATGAGLLTEADQKVIKEQMHQAGHLLEGWMLDSWSQDHRDSLRDTDTSNFDRIYCVNFQICATSVMGIISMIWPDFPQSKEWLRESQQELPKILFTEYALDGGYGEGSMNYWQASMGPLLAYMKASRHLGVRDYFSDPAVSDALRRTLAWRMNLTEPDGQAMNIGDAHRDATIPGGRYLLEAARELNEPTDHWVGRYIYNNGCADDPKRSAKLDPGFLLACDLGFPSTPPTELSVNHPYSGYGIFRSGWGPKDNFFLLKYGTTFVGRREREKNPIISGHAHADAQELELFHRGIPILIDQGTAGRYQDYDTYGGYDKATISRNSVGLGNIWGYDRLDGLYSEHVKEHGPGFLYEREQNNIGRSDTDLIAFGDVGSLGLISTKVKTFEKEQVTHQRTVVWFRDSGVTVVNDRMESPSVQPYEWYLNPIGKLLSNTNGMFTFGDDVAKLDVLPILPKEESVQILSKGDLKVPPYYHLLRPDGEQHQMTSMAKPKPMTERFRQITLLVLGKKAKETDFLNVLIPYEKDVPYSRSPLGTNGVKLTGDDSTLLIAAGGNNDPRLAVNGTFGVARLDHDELANYALDHGDLLSQGGQQLIKVELISKDWAPYFDSKVTGAVSLKDRRATFSLPDNPAIDHLLIDYPRVEAGKEAPQPIQVSVSFHVSAKPKRMISLRSSTQMPKLDDPEFTKRTSVWENDINKDHYRRQQIDFTWDEKTQSVSVLMDTGTRQLVWE